MGIFHSGGKAKLAFVLLILVINHPVAAQVNNPAYADYFLVGRFGEICTMCEAVVLCEAGADTPREAIPENGSFTIYHLQTRTFWSQVATIWEWFIANFDSDSLAQSGHNRPVIIYEVNAGTWSPGQTVDSHISLEPPVLEFGTRNIDRVERNWLQADNGTATGYCQRMPLWESLDVIAARAPDGGSP